MSNAQPQRSLGCVLAITRRIQAMTHWTAISLALILLWHFASHQAIAKSPGKVAPLSRQLMSDAQDGRLDEFTFFDASLIASGIDEPRRLDECRQRFGELCERFRAEEKELATTRELAAAVLSYLHREILTADYQIKTTRVDQALATGYYNCVASTILFRCLSAEFGLAPVVVATPSHVFCRYPGPDNLNVETTCPNWFALPHSSDIIAGHPANQADVPMRTLSDVEILGKLFYNRATDKLEAKEFAEACDLLRSSMALDPADSAARQNFLAAINNWALQRCEADDFAHAAQLIRQGRTISPEYLPIQMNDLHVHQQWAVDLCQRQQFAEALALLDANHQRRPKAELFDQGRFSVYGLWADALFSQGKDADALQLFQQASLRFPGRLEVQQRETASVLRAVQERIQVGQRTEAIALLEQCLSRQPDNLELKSKMHDLTIPKS